MDSSPRSRVPFAERGRHALDVVVTSILTELRARRRDRSLLMTTLVVAVALPLLLTVAIGRGAGADYRPQLAVVVPADDPVASSVLAALSSRSDLHLALTQVPDVAAARQAIRAGKVEAAIEIPAGLNELLGAGALPHVRAITASASPLAGDVATALASAIQDRVASVRAAGRIAQAAGTTAPDVSVVLRGLAEGGVDLHLRDLEDPDVSPLAYYGPSMTLLMSFLICGASARSLSNERASGVAERWWTAPTRWWAHDLGVALAAAILALGVSMVSWLIAALVFGVSWGSPLGVLALLVANAIAAAGISFVVLRLAGRGGNRIDGASGAVVLLVGLLGGHFVPLYQLPSQLRRISLATPSGWSLRAFSDMVLVHSGPAGALRAAAVVAVMGGALLVVAFASPSARTPAG